MRHFRNIPLTGGSSRCLAVRGGKALNRRRELGIIAGLFSDEAILTTDDPGMEDPEGICEEIREYVDMTGCSCHLVADRKKGRGAGRSAGKRRSEEPHADPAAGAWQ